MFDIYTEKIQPEIFFQEGSREIDTMHIHYDKNIYSYYTVQSLFT